MDPRDHEMLDRITMIRMRNNHLWMKIVEVALQHAPVETKTILSQINSNDRQVNDLLGDIAK
jgi:hypothetical protein